MSQTAAPQTARVALVTGAARGLGRDIARALLHDFDRVIAADADADALAACALSLGERCTAITMDVTSSQSVDAAFAAAVERFGTVDALVNNAGLMNPARVVDCTDAHWNALIETNLRGAFFCARAFARLRIARGGDGAMVNMASAAAQSARTGGAAYSASKAGIVMLTQTLALELGPHGIRVNAIEPGLVVLPDRETDPAYRESYRKMVPLGRLATPGDISEVVRFLLSDGACYIHGAALPVDGGFLAGRPLG